MLVAGCFAIGRTQATMSTGFWLTGVLYTSMALRTAIGRQRLGR